MATIRKVIAIIIYFVIIYIFLKAPKQVEVAELQADLGWQWLSWWLQ